MLTANVERYLSLRRALGFKLRNVARDLRAYAHHLSRPERQDADWPHLVCFLGDQVYADETSE